MPRLFSVASSPKHGSLTHSHGSGFSLKIGIRRNRPFCRELKHARGLPPIAAMLPFAFLHNAGRAPVRNGPQGSVPAWVSERTARVMPARARLIEPNHAPVTATLVTTHDATESPQAFKPKQDRLHRCRNAGRVWFPLAASASCAGQLPDVRWRGPQVSEVSKTLAAVAEAD